MAKKTPLDRAIKTGLAALNPDSYALVQAYIVNAREAESPFEAADACRQAQLELAKIATGPEFDPKRHRAIGQSLRALERHHRSSWLSQPMPLTTRGGR